MRVVSNAVNQHIFVFGINVTFDTLRVSYCGWPDGVVTRPAGREAIVLNGGGHCIPPTLRCLRFSSQAAKMLVLPLKARRSYILRLVRLAVCTPLWASQRMRG